VAPPGDRMQICSFLWVYYGYPASHYEGINVESVRYRCGAALARRDDVEIVSTDMSGWFTTRRLGLAHAGAKVVREKVGHKLLGAHLLGANAEDVINVFALAVRHGLTTEEVADAVWAYPTASSDIGYLV
jgi:pyruvate/2-oxoglutarate dehydrogenase complex dihydrolipoamide dehydrogenase (E3) component